MLRLLDHLKTVLDIEEVREIYVRINRTADNTYYARARYMLVYADDREIDLYHDLDEGDVIEVGSTADYTNLKRIKVRKDDDVNISIDLNSAVNTLSRYSADINIL